MNFYAMTEKNPNQRKNILLNRRNKIIKYHPICFKKNKTRYIRYNSEDKIDHIHQYDS